MKEAKWTAAVDQEVKLVLSQYDPPSLFDMASDPDEIIIVYGISGYREVSHRLEQLLIIAMKKYGLPLSDMTAVWASKLPCFDTKDQIPDLPNQVCRDLMISPEINECASDNASNFCPNTCGLCCQDSEGFILNRGVP